MKEFKGNNGAKIVINSASFKEASKLKNCIAKELLKQNIDIGNASSLNALKNELNDSVPKLVNMLKNVILSCDTSEEFESALFACLAHCTYNSARINEQLFDDIPEAREDYYTIMLEVIKENLLPFFKGLLSKLSTQNPIKDNSPK